MLATHALGNFLVLRTCFCSGAYFHKQFHRDHPELCLQMSSKGGATKARSEITAQHHNGHQPIMPTGPFPGMMMMPGMPYFMPPPHMMMPMNPMQLQQAMWQAQYMRQMEMVQAAATSAAAVGGPMSHSNFPMPAGAVGGPMSQSNFPMMPNMMMSTMMMGQQQQPPLQHPQQQLYPLPGLQETALPPTASEAVQYDVKDDVTDDVASEEDGGASESLENDNDGDDRLDGDFAEVDQSEDV